MIDDEMRDLIRRLRPRHRILALGTARLLGILNDAECSELLALPYPGEHPRPLLVPTGEPLNEPHTGSGPYR